MWATLASRAPVVATFHSGATRSRLFDLAAPVLRRVARRIAVRIAVSEAAAAFVARPDRRVVRDRPERGGRGPVRDGDPRPTSATGTKLLFVGRLDERKGFPTAVAAFARLAAEPARTCGSSSWATGPTAAAADALEPEIRDRVTFLGSVPNRDLPPIHAACDLYLGTVGGRRELRDRARRGDGGRPARSSRATSRATTRWCATASTGCWCRRATPRPWPRPPPACSTIRRSPASPRRGGAGPRRILRLGGRDRPDRGALRACGRGATAVATIGPRRPSGSSSPCSPSSSWGWCSSTTVWCAPRPGGQRLVADRRAAPAPVRPDPEPGRDRAGLRRARA